MSSRRARAFALMTRLLVRRRDWGPPAALARRARRLFGAPAVYRWLRSFGVDVSHVADPDGERIVPRGAARRTTRLTILYLHGGGYVSCSPATHRPITAALARLGPATVYVPDYPLAPEHPYPAALNAVERAYRSLLAQGVDPRTLAIAGDSAGGGLTLALLFRLRAASLPMPACAVVLSPWTEVAGTLPSVRANDGRCAMFRPANMPAFAECYAPRDQWAEPEVSPLYGRFDALPPLHVQVGADELLRDDAVRVHDAVRAAGGSSELHVIEGVFHGWHMLDGLVPEARTGLEQVADFVRRAIGGPGAGSTARGKRVT